MSIDETEIVFLEDVYTPSHDSYILMETVMHALRGGLAKQLASGLEIGSGTGYITVRLAKLRMFSYAIMSDIDSNAVYSSWATAKANNVDDIVDVVQCDSATCIRGNSVDIIYFNPPYLPTCDDVDGAIAWNGGAFGLELWNRFFTDAVRICNDDCFIVAVFSSLQDLEKLFNTLSRCKHVEIFSCQSFFYETLCGAVLKCQ